MSMSDAVVIELNALKNGLTVNFVSTLLKIVLEIVALIFVKSASQIVT